FSRDWSSDACSSDLSGDARGSHGLAEEDHRWLQDAPAARAGGHQKVRRIEPPQLRVTVGLDETCAPAERRVQLAEEHLKILPRQLVTTSQAFDPVETAVQVEHLWAARCPVQ